MQSRKKKHPNFTVGEEDCDGLCPDIRVRGDLGNHQFRSIINIMTKMSIKLMKMTMMLILMFFMTMMAICFWKLNNDVRFTMGGRSIAQVAIS